MSEKAIEKQILEYLELRKAFPCKIERQGTFDPSKGKYRANKSKFKRNGISDVMFFWKDRVYFCELKTPEKYGYISRNFDKLKNRLVKSQQGISNQIEFILSVREKGQIGFICDSVERLEKILRQKPKEIEIIESE